MKLSRRRVAFDTASDHAPCTFGENTCANDSAVWLGITPSASTPAACHTPSSDPKVQSVAATSR